MDDRAETDVEKMHVINRLLDVWQNNPHLRLGQLLLNAGVHYSIEDYHLIRRVENFYKPEVKSQEDK